MRSANRRDGLICQPCQLQRLAKDRKNGTMLSYLIEARRGDIYRHILEPAVKTEGDKTQIKKLLEILLDETDLYSRERQVFIAEVLVKKFNRDADHACKFLRMFAPPTSKITQMAYKYFLKTGICAVPGQG